MAGASFKRGTLGWRAKERREGRGLTMLLVECPKLPGGLGLLRVCARALGKSNICLMRDQNIINGGGSRSVTRKI